MKKNFDCSICHWRRRTSTTNDCSILLRTPQGQDCPRFTPEQRHGATLDEAKIRNFAKRQLATILDDHADILGEIDETTRNRLLKSIVDFSKHSRSVRSEVRRARSISAANIILACGDCGHEASLDEMPPTAPARCSSCGSSNISLE